MKKFLAILLAAMMLLATAGVAFAAEVEVDVKIDTGANVDISDHQFKAYQIFSGTQSANSTALGDIEWGTGVNTGAVDGKTLVKELIATFNWTWPTKTNENNETVVDEDAITAQFVADQLKGKEFNNAEALTFAHIMDARKVADAGQALTTGSNKLETGYYLVVDETNVDGQEATAANASLLQITGGEIQIQVKTDKPFHEKKVQENSEKYDENEKSGYGYDFGAGYNDVADYNIGDIVPFSLYSKVPDLSNYTKYEMTFHDVMSESLTLKVDSIKVTVGGVELEDDEYTVSYTYDEDAKKVVTQADGCTFEVKIHDLKGKAKDAPIRVDFNAVLNETAVIGLNGNPNQSFLEFSNNPDDTTSTGKTPWDYVLVFTYELDVTKVDGTDTSKTLKDAEFKLQNATTMAYVIVDENTGKVTGWTNDEDTASVLKSDENGNFKVIGLDDGKYTLTETKAPAGYNLLAKPVEIEVKATTDNGHDYENEPTTALTALNIVVDGSEAAGAVQEGTVTTQVKNNSGATLPETGGIGTTLFYMFGGIMAAGSALMLVVRRRADAEEE